jgi:hypothetical protein
VERRGCLGLCAVGDRFERTLAHVNRGTAPGHTVHCAMNYQRATLAGRAAAAATGTKTISRWSGIRASLYNTVPHGRRLVRIRDFERNNLDDTAQ